jgi:RNA polymerase sporulation-specific sigma factor
MNDHFQNFTDTFTSKPAFTEDINRCLMKEYKETNDDGIYDQLVQGNMRLVLKMAKAFTNRGIDYEDLVSYGTIGLMKAIKSYDHNHERKCKNIVSYLHSCIVNEIRNAFRKNMSVHVPCHAYEKFSEDQKRTIVPLSLNEKIENREDDFTPSLMALRLSPSEKAELNESIHIVKNAIATVLTKTEAKALLMNRGIGCEPMRVQKVASALKMNRTKTGRIIAEATRKLKVAINA